MMQKPLNWICSIHYLQFEYWYHELIENENKYDNTNKLRIKMVNKYQQWEWNDTNNATDKNNNCNESNKNNAKMRTVQCNKWYMINDILFLIFMLQCMDSKEMILTR